MAKTIRAEDHIDRFLAEVAGRLPTLDLQVEGIVDRVMGIQRRLRRMLDETLEEHGLTYGEWMVLASLHWAPNNRRTAGELATKVELSSAAMTNRLDRLESAGLIRRLPDPGDRRGALIEPTEAGHAAWERAVGTQAER